MFKKCCSVLLFVCVYLNLLPISGVIACGVERWSVKTGTDPDAGLVNLNAPQSTTIASMRARTAPNPIPTNNRVAPAETTLWVINATITEYKSESDQDYHIVIQDASGNTMIAEIPAPTCVGASSPFKTGITNARSQFDSHFTVTSSFQTTNTPVQITGVGMFDFLHGQTGVAPNGIELHPVLNVNFNPTNTPDFSVGASPASLTVAQGSSGNSTISTSLVNGFNSDISFSASGLPTGTVANFVPSLIAAPGSGSTLMTISPGASTPTGTSTVTVTATGGGVTHTTTVGLTVTATDFSVSASPTTLSVNQGGSGSSTISTSITGSFNSTVSLSASGLPTGASVVFSPTSIASPGSGTSTLTITAGASTPTGTSTVTVTASGGGKTHTTTISLTVSASAADFSIASSPTSLSIVQGNTGTSTISTTISGSFNSAVSLSASGLPTGASASLSPTSIAAPGSGSSTLTITVGASTATGTSTVTVTGTGGGKTHSTTVSLTVTASSTPDFAISASPTSLSVVQGISGTSALSTTVSGGFNSALSLSASGLPTGASTSFSPVSITAPGAGSSTLTITVGAATPTGTSTVTVTATGGGKTHTATISLTVTASGGTQLLGNPGFENGSASPAPWSATSGVINNSTSEPPHAGSWDAWLDGYGTTHTDTVSQQVAIPSTITTATLAFWLHIDTAETSTTTAFDTLTVQVRNTSGTVLSTLVTYSNLDHNTGYRQVSFDLSSFKGQTIQIWLVGAEDFTLQTSFVVDDFTLIVQ